MNKIEVGKGFIELIRTMSSEAEICEIARISTGSTGHNDKQLIEHLVKNGHNEVLEFGQLIFKIRCSIVCARQWFRYRTGSFNEASGRYRKLNFGNYESDEFSENMKWLIDDCTKLYEFEIENDMKKEDARYCLPLATMTEFYWRTDCNNIMNFLKQRLHKSAQTEIRGHAEAVHELTKRAYPNLIEVFDNHVRIK